MPLCRARFLMREQVAEGTMAFHFEKPAGFSFRAGQAVSLELTGPPAGDEPGSRIFSLVSAPFESELVVATRMREGSVFKRTLKALPEGADVKIEGPFGDLILDAAGPSAVFIAGGIGITPFMSMLRQATQDASPQKLSLIYSNRRPEDAAFLAELLELERQNRRFRLLATMTEMGGSHRKWDGETGFVSVDLVKRFVEEVAEPVYYVVGPPAMVEAMQRVLDGAGITGDNIRTEEFYGY